MNSADREPWQAEADAAEFDERAYDVAFAAELPGELAHAVAAADSDPGFDTQYDEWLECIFGNPGLMLALEQSCSEGILLPWDMRGVRLQSAPGRVLDSLHLFLESCPTHVVAHLAHFTFWLLRAERVQRRGTPDWSPKSPLPPIEDERAFFRPATLRTRRYSG